MCRKIRVPAQLRLEGSSWKEKINTSASPCCIAAIQRGKERIIRYSGHNVRDVKQHQRAKPTITSKQILSVTWKVKVFAAFCAHCGSLLEKKLCHSRAHNIFHVRVVRQISWHRYYETEKNYCIIVFVYPMTSLFFFFTSYICFHHAEINFISSSQRNKKNSLNWETRATSWLNKFSDLIGWNFFYFPLLVKLMLLDLLIRSHNKLSRNFSPIQNSLENPFQCLHPFLRTIHTDFFFRSKDLVEISFPRSRTHCIKQNLNDSTEKGPFRKKENKNLNICVRAQQQSSSTAHVFLSLVIIFH